MHHDLVRWNQLLLGWGDSETKEESCWSCQKERKKVDSGYIGSMYRQLTEQVSSELLKMLDWRMIAGEASPCDQTRHTYQPSQSRQRGKPGLPLDAKIIWSIILFTNIDYCHKAWHRWSQYFLFPLFSLSRNSAQMPLILSVFFIRHLTLSSSNEWAAANSILSSTLPCR